MPAGLQSLCPRCGYDLRGQIASWTDHSPLQGICPECGLQFHWTHILHPTRSVPRWSIEHGPKFRIRAAISTFFRSLWPWTFWKAVRIEQPIRPKRLVVYTLLIAVAVHLCFAGAGIGTVARTQYQWMTWTTPNSQIDLYAYARSVLEQVWPVLIWPYSSMYYGAFSPVRFSHHPVLWGVPIVLAFIPFCFLLLPQSMRKARIRKAHLVRGCVYTISVLPLAALAYAVIFQFTPLWYRIHFEPMTFPVIGITICYSIVMWTAIIKDYLRLPHGLGVSLAIHAVAILLSALVLLAVFGHRLFW